MASKAVNIDLSNYATKDMISSGVNYQGSVANWAALPSGAAKGDMYNVEAEDTAHGCPAGGNVIWSGTAWDVVGPLFVITSITNAQIDALFE